MAKSNSSLLIARVAMQIAGDWGPLTTYTSRRGQIVVFPKAPPTSPPSPRQLTERQRFRNAAAAWWALTAAKRDAWLLAARRAHLSIGGYNLWLWYLNNPQDTSIIRTVERQSGISLL